MGENMLNIYQALPDESKKIIQEFLLEFKKKIANDITDYQRVTQEIKKTAEKGLETRMQLHQIDKETEKAATGIIEKSELMMDRQNELTELAKQMNNNLREEGNKLMPGFENLLLNILEVGKAIKGKEVEKSLKDKIMQIEQDLILMTADKIRSQKLLLDIANKLEDNANSNLDDLFEILNLCQFQDITSQELAKAHSLIKTIIERLNFVLEAFHVNGLEIDDKMEIKAFDSNAAFTDRTKEQKEADALFSSPSPSEESKKIETSETQQTAPQTEKSEDLFEKIQQEMKQQESSEVLTEEEKNTNPEDIFEQLQKEMQQNEEEQSKEEDIEDTHIDDEELEKLLSEADQITSEQDSTEDEEIEIPEDLLNEIAGEENTEKEEISQEEEKQEEEDKKTAETSPPPKKETAKNNNLDIDELAKKFEEAGSGEVISQEEIDRILSGG